MNNENLIIWFLALLSILGYATILYENKNRAANQNDERWQMITTKANTMTLYSIWFLLLPIALISLVTYTGFTGSLASFNDILQKNSALFMLGVLFVLPFLISVLRIIFLAKYNREL